jgi:methylated-DNA-[protein]-cysteine S-methyltransferase
MLRHAIIATALGHVGLASSGSKLVRVVLPLPDRRQVARRLGIEAEADHPLGARIRSYAAGEPIDFSDVDVDFGPMEPLALAVYAEARRIPAGEVVTYGELADRLGLENGARAVGAALGRNPVPLVVPCHRIVAAGGRLGGFSAPGGSFAKARLLEHEGARLQRADPAQGSFGF